MEVLQAQAVAKKKCCFCVPLRVGLLSLAYFNLVLALVTFFGPFLPFASRMEVLATAYDSELTTAAEGILLMPLIVDFIYTVVLLYGLHKNNSMVLYAYMWYAVTNVVGTIYVCCVTISTVYSPAESIITTSLSVLLETFLLILVRNFRQEISLTATTATKLPLYKQQQESVERDSFPQPTAPAQVSVTDAVEKTSL